MTQAETRAFKIHPQLLFDVIQRQAGSLTKALCEGVMNSIDAGASEIVVTLTDRTATIADDGNGFKSRKEIEDFFETFGQPHNAGDAVYGTFRMGRGQLFSFGRNRWRSGRFAMDVDIKNRGLDYDLSEAGEAQKGCRVEITLYRELTLLQQREISDELRRYVRYVPVPVVLDGTVVNRDPRAEKWDMEDDDAFYKFSTGRLSIYNLGVFVNDSRAYSYGIGGTVVAKQQLRLNFARNDVLGDCPVWARIGKVLRQRADTNIDRKKTTLNAEERALLALKLRSGIMDTAAAREAAVFQDATGRWLSIERLGSMAWTHNNKLSCGSKGPRAERVQRSKLAVVLNSDLFEEFFQVSSLEELVDKVIRPFAAYWQYKVVPLHTLSPINDGVVYNLVNPAQYTPMEQVVLRVCENLSNPDFARRRKVVLGDSTHALGWTDGTSFIAIDRRFLKGKDIAAPHTWASIALLLCHEYVHADASSSDTHVHSPEFYEQYHDVSDRHVMVWVWEAMKHVPKAVEGVGLKLQKASLRQLDHMTRVLRHRSALVAQTEDAIARVEIAAAEGGEDTPRRGRQRRTPSEGDAVQPRLRMVLADAGFSGTGLVFTHAGGAKVDVLPIPDKKMTSRWLHTAVDGTETVGNGPSTLQRLLRREHQEHEETEG